jgi:hypothetical protein
MNTAELEQIAEIIDERMIRFARAVGLGTLRPPGVVADDLCGCWTDQGCCKDKGCCNDKGSDPADIISDPAWGDLVGLSDRLGISVDELIRRVEGLDPKLMGAKSKK